MKVVIFGANGKTGSLLVEKALAKDYKVVAYVRKAGSILIENPNLKVIVGHLNEKLNLTDAISGADACISALGGGSLTHRSPEIVEGIANIVSIMEQEVVPRFIYLSSLGAGESRLMMPLPMRFLVADIMLRAPLADHNANEQFFANSKLKWTSVRPGALNDGPVTNNLKHGSEISKIKGMASISRENVAMFMIKQLKDENYVKKAVWLYE
ncbi:MAG: NAD(P)H-binding protein [Paludibacter sp.]|nr:NAD(P)H-binding protein [Paludibacter sp.]